MPSLALVSQQLQSFYLQAMRRVLSSGQTSVWQRGNEEVRYLPLVLEEMRERLGTAPVLCRQTCLTNCGPQCDAGPFSFCHQPSLLTLLPQQSTHRVTLVTAAGSVHAAAA